MIAMVAGGSAAGGIDIAKLRLSFEPQPEQSDEELIEMFEAIAATSNDG